MFEKIKKLLVDELQVSGDITEDSALAELESTLSSWQTLLCTARRSSALK